MTGHIDKTVFISYRRTNFWTALAVFQNLHGNRYDVFFDYKSIPSGDFEQAIIENIKSRAHFIVILSSSALERCNEPGDWLRREIETAIEYKRNIVPLFMEGFDFGSEISKSALTGTLANLNKYNGLSIPAEYFEEAMAKLCSDRFLNRPLESLLHPVSDLTKQITEEQLDIALKALPVKWINLTAQEWFERGYVGYENGNINEAIRCYTESINLQPNDSTPYYNRAIAYHAQGNLGEAISDYTKVIDLKPDDVEALTSRAILFGKIEKIDAAIVDLDMAVKLRPDLALNYYHRGLAYDKKGDKEKALFDYNEAIRINPNLSKAYNNRGLIRSDKNDLEGAIEDFTLAIERNSPEPHVPHNNRGSVYAMQDKGLDHAIIDFSKAIKINPNFAEAYNNRGLAKYKKGNIKGAILDFNKGISLQEPNADVFFYRGRALYMKDDFDNAIRDCNEAIRLAPYYCEAYIVRGLAYYKKGNLDKAIADHDKSIFIKPDYADAYRNRASLLEQKENSQMAIIDYIKYLDLSNEEQGSAKKEIEKK